MLTDRDEPRTTSWFSGYSFTLSEQSTAHFGQGQGKLYAWASGTVSQRSAGRDGDGDGDGAGRTDVDLEFAAEVT